MKREWQEIHDTIDEKYEHKYLKTKDVNWHYVECGSKEGDLVLLVHGLPECWYSWSLVMPLINQNYRIIAVDMKGQGRSVTEDHNYEWHNVAKQLMEFVDGLNINKFHIVGHDWGAIITSILVGDFPERILSFTRMEADLLPPGESMNTYKKKPQWLLFKNKFIGKMFLKRTAKSGMFTKLCYKNKRMPRILRKITDEEYAYLSYEFARPGVAEAAASYFLPINRDMEGLFNKIAYNKFNFPVIQLQADSDPSQPVDLFTKVDDLCENVKMKWVINSSHFSNLDQPEQVAEAINEVLNMSKEYI